MGRMRNIQGLRAIAALLVVVVHLGGQGGFIPNNMSGLDPLDVLHPIGNVGVDLFFAISGVIMVVTTSRAEHTPRSAARFLVRRMLRVYPPYIILTFVLWSPTLRHPDFLLHVGDLVRSISLWPSGSMPILFTGWTLTYELYFYVVFAVSLLVARRWQTAVFIGWGIVTIAIAILVQPTTPFGGLVGDLLNLEFLFGVVIGRAVLRGALRFPAPSVLLGAAGVLASYLVIAGPGAELPSTPVRVATVGVFAALIVYGAIGLEERGLVAPAALVGLGEWSFALYLIHPLVMKAAGPAVQRLPASVGISLVVAVGVVAVSIAAAGLFHRFVEQPCLRFSSTVMLKRPDRLPLAIAKAG